MQVQIALLLKHAVLTQPAVEVVEVDRVEVLILVEAREDERLFAGAWVDVALSIREGQSVDTVGEGGKITTTQADASMLFYLVLGLVIAAIVLVVIHPGRDAEASPKSYYGQ